MLLKNVKKRNWFKINTMNKYHAMIFKIIF